MSVRGLVKEPVKELAESAARVHQHARAGLGLNQQEALLQLAPWMSVAGAFVDLPDQDFRISELTMLVIQRFALYAECPPVHPIYHEGTMPAWEAVARHLCQWVNELAEGSLNGMEANEELWKQWAEGKKQSLAESH